MRAIDSRVAITVIGGTLLAIGQHLIGLVQFLEAGLSLLVTGIAVRMVLHRLLAKGTFEVGIRRSLSDAQNLVIVALGHGRGQLFSVNVRRLLMLAPRSQRAAFLSASRIGFT